METMKEVKVHHELVREHGFKPVFTSLLGSQNYRLDIETSDIDTITFVMPSYDELAFAAEPVGGEFEVADGKCIYKDIRVALNLLKKTSPSSVEYFTSHYKYFEPSYSDVLNKYLSNDMALNMMVHCNYSHMLYACAGMSAQLAKRNMPAGKRYSHALRLLDMTETFLRSLDHRYLLNLLPTHYAEANAAKRDTRAAMDDYYNEGCNLVARQLTELRDNFQMSAYKQNVEIQGKQLIEQFQRDLFAQYINNEVVNEH